MEIAIRVFVYLIIINIVRSIISKKKSEDELADNVICLPNYSNLIKVCSLIILIIVAFISIIEKNVIENTGALIAGVILLIFAVLLYLFAVYIEYTRIVFDEEKIVERELFVGTKEFYYKDITSCIDYGKKNELYTELGVGSIVGITALAHIYVKYAKGNVYTIFFCLCALIFSLIFVVGYHFGSRYSM